MEKIIEKIEKLLALAEKNPNENEAMSAALKAQELIAKYNIDIATLGASKEEPEIGTASHTIPSTYHFNRKWRYDLADVIARNFRCKMYVIGRDYVVFYGHKSDAQVALQTFTFLFNTGNKLAVKYYNDYRKTHSNSRGVLNAYLNGFTKGVAEALDKQCRALMLVIPKEVEEQWTTYSAGFGSMKNTLYISADDTISEAGRRDGKNIAESRYIE